MCYNLYISLNKIFYSDETRKNMKKNMALITPGIGEYEEKKSKFIAHIKGVETEEQANEYIAELKKEYWDARHNCYAYVIGEKNEIQRFSDDGEPSGTAGKPILDVLNGSGINNAVIVVTRYFGGVLLGTGGLVRAYQKSSQDAIDKSVIVEKKTGKVGYLKADYGYVGKLQYIAANLGVHQLDAEYGECVTFKYLIPDEVFDKFKESVDETTSGSVEIENTATVKYGINSGSVIIDL